ncbi:MAG TPA: TAXI family TRAP transporter solute-binding subunit, partial [Burkholderiales bacterium]|nr:TAXI family TRAP transporter solute-binding subunit [Burkholderiales bacterium]
GAEGATGLMTLGSVFYEPLWCFYRGAAIPLGTGLRGRRIAVGVPGSGTREVALRLLREIGMAGPPTRLVDIGGLEAAQALEGGEVDAAFYVSSADAAAVQRLLRAPGVNLLPAQRAEAVTRRLTFLHKLTLPEGAVDLARDIPRRDVPMLAVTASLVASEDLHPVIVDLLLEAARSVHGGPGLFHGIGEFPAPRDLEFPLSPDAERFYRGNPPLLRRYLPFWAVVWINRFIVVGIPLLLLALPFLRFLPSVYQWRMRRRIYRWYGELRFIESDVRLGTVDPAQLRVRLDRLERQVEGLRVPHAYSSMHYLLKSHIQLVRDLIAGRTA